jgi:hypothetical protein
MRKTKYERASAVTGSSSATAPGGLRANTLYYWKRTLFSLAKRNPGRRAGPCGRSHNVAQWKYMGDF